MTVEKGKKIISEGIYDFVYQNLGEDTSGFDNTSISVYYKDGRLIDERVFKSRITSNEDNGIAHMASWCKCPPLVCSPIIWDIYTMENDIRICLKPYYKLNRGLTEEPFIRVAPNIELEKIDLIIDIIDPVSFDRSKVIDADTLVNITNTCNGYSTANKKIHELLSDKTKFETIIQMIDDTNKILPHPFEYMAKDDFANLKDNRDKSVKILNKITKRIGQVRNAKEEQIRAKRAKYEQDGVYIPDYYKVHSGSGYYSVVDIADPFSSSYQKWERGELGIIHGIKL